MSNKNRHKKRVKQTEFFFPDMIENRARQDLRDHKFRRAVDGFKELRKKDKTGFLPELLESYRGLAGQMIEKGQLDEARGVMDYLKTISGEKGDGLVEATIALKGKDYNKAAEIYADSLSRGEEMPEKDGMPVVADVLVISFSDYPQLETSRPEISRELKCVRQALEKICGERYEEAREEIKNIGIKSMFSNWKLFIKGLAAFYENEDQKAVAAFERLLPGSRLREIAESWLFLLSDGIMGENKHDHKSLEKACIVAGHPGLVPVLPRADYLWMAGRHSDSYQHVRATMDSFPSEDGGIREMLSRFYFNSVFHLSEKAAQRYLEGLEKINNALPSDLQDVLIRRAQSLFRGWESMADHKCVEAWEGFLNAFKRVYGDNKRLNALVYSHLGSIFVAGKIKSSPRPWQSGIKKTGLRNASLAEKFLQKSMDLCPDDMEACMKLLMVYEKANKKSQFNKLLEKLSLLFPDDKNILIRAGLDCVSRKAYSKGVKFLERARELDSLDGTIKNHLAYAYLLEALNFFDKGKIAKGRSVYESALKNGLDNSDDLNRGKAYIYTRWAGKEFILSNEDEGREKMALAWSKAKDHFSILYFTFLIFKSYGVLEVYIQKPAREMEEELQKTPTSQRAVSLLKIYSYMAMADISKTPWLELERKRALNYALKAAKGPCSREDAMFIAMFSIQAELDYKLAKKYTKKMLLEDKQDPCFLYLNFKMKKMERFGRPVKGEMEELKNILLLAEKRNDKNTAQSVRKEIADVEQGFGLGGIFNQPFPFGDFDEDEDEDDEEDFNIIESLVNEFFSIGGRGRKKGKKRR